MEHLQSSVLSAPMNYLDDNVVKPIENKAINFYSLTLEDLKT